MFQSKGIICKKKKKEKKERTVLPKNNLRKQ